MMYKVLDTFRVGRNTSVTVEGNGEEFKENMIVLDSDGNPHNLISVAMLAGISAERIGKTTTVLIEGEFSSDTIKL